ncbi:MAG TPA: OsmC family protein [Bacteroidales bacterium]|nr:OsmC family protein [Bacteroidales bacterium]
MNEILITMGEGKVVSALVNGHTINTDQPADNGGLDSSPAPFDLFLASIGTCAGIYVKSFCEKRQLDPKGITIVQTLEYGEDKRVPSGINLDIRLPQGFPGKYRDAVINAAELCLVKKTINKKPEFRITTTQL